MNLFKYLVSLIAIMATANVCNALSDWMVFGAVVLVTALYMIIPPYEAYQISKKSDVTEVIGSK